MFSGQTAWFVRGGEKPTSKVASPKFENILQASLKLHTAKQSVFMVGDRCHELSPFKK